MDESGLTYTVVELWSALGLAVVLGALIGLAVAWFNSWLPG